MLTPVVGGEEEHGEGASDLGRWRVLLDSGSRVGAEFAESWRALKTEAESAAEWLGGEVEGPLAAEVASAGKTLKGVLFISCRKSTISTIKRGLIC